MSGGSSQSVTVSRIHIIDWYDGVVTGMVETTECQSWLTCLLAEHFEDGRVLYLWIPLAEADRKKLADMKSIPPSEAKYDEITALIRAVASGAPDDAVLSSRQSPHQGDTVQLDRVTDQRIHRIRAMGNFTIDLAYDDPERQELLG